MLQVMRAQSIWFARRHFIKRVRSTVDGFVKVMLPWGLPLQVSASDVIGKKIVRLGVFDLAVCECIARLASPGSTVIDVGANCGQMTSLMACFVGPKGKVLAFEPHPRNFALLKQNLQLWRSGGVAQNVQIFEVALGPEDGTAEIGEPPGFSGNSGLATVSQVSERKNLQAVPIKKLDGFSQEVGTVSVLKIDVEGFELAVLEGAKSLLEEKKIANIVFEDHAPRESRVVALLRDHGYSIYGLSARTLRLELVPFEKTVEVSNFVASLDENALHHALQGIGYRSLRRHRSTI